MVRYGDLGSDTMISYRIKAYKKAGLIMGRSGRPNCGCQDSLYLPKIDRFFSEEKNTLLHNKLD